MKKYIFILVLFFGISHAQKIVSVYNLSSKTIRLQMIVTKPPTGTYPWCASVSPTQITLAPYSGQFILKNTSSTTKFPFLSTVSPVITNWRKLVFVPPGPNGSFTNLTSALLYADAITPNQNFNYLTFSIYNTANTINLNAGGTIGVSTQPSIPFPSQAISVDYGGFQNTPTEFEHSIIFTDI
jgi:hypothetical protein